MGISQEDMTGLVVFKDAMAELYKSLIYGKFKDEHVTKDMVERCKAEVRDYMAENHPEMVVESVEEELVQNPYNIVLNVVVFDASVADKPFRVEFPLLYWSGTVEGGDE